jgi:hypothetical protein
MTEQAESYGRRTARFAERFDGYALKDTYEIAWPVYEHVLTVTVRRSVPLNAIEEGLLRLVQAGISEREELRSFLGIGYRYHQQLVTCLTGETGALEPLLITRDENLRVSEKAAEALVRCEKTQLHRQDYPAHRDAMFGGTLTGSPLELLDFHESEAISNAWMLAPVADADADPESNWHQPVLDTVQESDVCEAQVSRTGSLRWIRLVLASYMQDDPKSGHSCPKRRLI